MRSAQRDFGPGSANQRAAEPFDFDLADFGRLAARQVEQFKRSIAGPQQAADLKMLIVFPSASILPMPC
ncbi:MAG: hypothetical protein ACKOPM_15825 [Novosphingobium sp.]